MKRSLATTDEDNNEGDNNNPMYMMMEGLDDEEICVEITEKKRRLKVDQVKALEKNFEVENKLEPERKVKLAQELGLQPRQVAVWFQNRRARWKTKQLERDYGLLKANYDSLKLNYESLHRDNQTLLNQIKEMKSKLNHEDESKAKYDTEQEDEETENNENGLAIGVNDNPLINFGDHLKDGSSDSDSSAILNDQESPILNGSSSCSMNITFQFSGSNQKAANDGAIKNQYSYKPPLMHQFVKIEEHDFFGHEEVESCSSLFTGDDQAPTLHWYSSDNQDWNFIN